MLLGAQLGDYAAQALREGGSEPVYRVRGDGAADGSRRAPGSARTVDGVFSDRLAYGIADRRAARADWDAIDLKARTLTVSQQCTRDGNLGTTKTGKTRVVDLTETLVAQLTAYRNTGSPNF